MELEFKVIDLSSQDSDDINYIERVEEQYTDICRSVHKTRALRKKGLFSMEMQEIEGTVPGLSMKPLTRMMDDESVYNKTKNIVILCLDHQDRILGFLGGIINIMPLFDDEEAYNKLETYDRVKYTNIYNHFIAPEEDDKNIPMSWTEIICVLPEARGQRVAEKLMDQLTTHALKTEQKDEILTGLDIVGTLERGINLGLKTVYEKMGYVFPEDLNKEALTMFEGAQFAGKRLNVKTK